MKYQQLTATCELHLNLLHTYTMSTYIGGGVLYHYNMNGKLIPIDSEVEKIKTNDGINPNSLEWRLLLGMNTKHVDVNLFFDFNITPSLDPTQFDNYRGPIESHLKRKAGVGLACRIFL